MPLTQLALPSGSPADWPNILILLCHDVGWGEFGFQGSKDIPTPHIDSVARGGVRFTQGYDSDPYCGPSRSGLLTGRYQTRFGHEFNQVTREHSLPPSEVTIGDRFRSLGFATCAIGKWHLGRNSVHHPWKRGFDEFYGTLANTPYYHPTLFVDTRVSTQVQSITDEDLYTTDAWNAEQSAPIVAPSETRPRTPAHRARRPAPRID